MNLSTAIFLGVVATLAAAAAIIAGPDTGIAIPAAAVAVGAAAVLLVTVLDRTLWPSPSPRSRASASSTQVRSAFEAGEYGRLELLSLLDTLEQESASSPARPGLSSEQIATLQAMTPEAFRGYLNARVTELERRT